jgi:phage gp29-like protein
LNEEELPKQLALSSETPSGPKRLPGETEGIKEPVKSKEAEGRTEGSEIKKSVPIELRAELARGRSLPVREDALEPKTPVQLVREAEKKYLSAIALLTRDAEQRPSRLDSETRAKLNGALVAVNRTILSTRKAVQQNPNDPLAVQYMLSAYEKKVDVLKEMSSY